MASMGHTFTHACSPFGPPSWFQNGVFLHRSHFWRVLVLEVPLHARRREGARLHAALAADALALVHEAHARLGVGVHGAHGAGFHAGRVGALAALVLHDVVGGKLPSAFFITWMRESEVLIRPRCASEHEMTHVSQPAHFFASTSR